MTLVWHSQGRFIAYQTEFLDPATLPPGTRLTILGQVSGSVTQSLDEADYTYPTLIVKHLKAWPTYSYDSDRYRQGYPYYGPYPYSFYHGELLPWMHPRLRQTCCLLRDARRHRHLKTPQSHRQSICQAEGVDMASRERPLKCPSFA